MVTVTNLIYFYIRYVQFAKGFLSCYTNIHILLIETPKIVSNSQEIPQSQTADKHMAPRGRAMQPSRDTRRTN